MAKKSLDLTTLLPKQYRDKTLDTIFKNLFNRHVSKSDTVPLFGYIGDGEIDSGEILIQEPTLERQINQITSMIYVEHATEKKVFSWPDLVQKLVLLGVSYDRIGEWFKSSSYNFMPPINIDKFCNFSEYFWIGAWVKKAPNLPYWKLGVQIDEDTVEGGIPTYQYMINAFAQSNVDYKPEYYTIARARVEKRPTVNPATGEASFEYAPVSPSPRGTGLNGNLPTWTDWSLTNLWVHKEDVVRFMIDHGNMVSFNELIQASRPILEYSYNLRINTYQLNGVPSESGAYNPPRKIRTNQPPLFDVFLRDGTHSGYTSAIFYYVEGSDHPVDPVVGRRIAVDKNADYIFEHSLVSSDDELLFFKTWNGSNFDLKTIWTPGPEHSPKYVKYDNSGTLINHDKFTNYRNYFWTGIDKPNLPSYNPTGEPEYSMIEKGGTSDWSVHNYWVHVSQLKRSEITLYPQAARPIVEFNVNLEAELVRSKTSLGQLPRFKMYAYSKTIDDYVQIPSTIPELANLNDAYADGVVFACLDDLEPTLKQLVLNSAELRNQLYQFTKSSTETLFYLQGLAGGRYLEVRDGSYYGYRAEPVSLLDSTKGRIVNLQVTGAVVPEVLTLTYNLDTNLFDVVGSVSGAHSPAIPGSDGSVPGVTFTITNGTDSFEHGDVMMIDVKGFVYEAANLYAKVGTDYRTLDLPESIFNEGKKIIKVESSPLNRDGVWEVPPQLEWNVQNENRQRIKEGDLYFHFTSIIAAQPDLLGSATGSNNWRSIDQNPGLGGYIKQFDGNVALLVSLLIQEGITVPSILEFARQSYEMLFNSVHAFVEERLPSLLTEVKFNPPQAGDAIDSRIVDEFKEYFKKAAAPKSVFDDTISPIPGLVATLPYLGLAPKVKPRKETDLELNLQMMVHHDGHRSRLTPRDTERLKKFVTKKFPRKLGQETPGFVTAHEFPVHPYKGQFWFQSSSGKLFFYNVVADDGVLPDEVKIGDFVSDRINGRIWQWNGTWNELGVYEVNLPWTEVKLDLIEQNLILAVETELYEKCPIVQPRLDDAHLEAHPDFILNMKKELERFGVIYDTPDVYSSAYSSSNAFTWNYSAIAPASTWNEIYRLIYGTPRPDVQPWIPAGYESEQHLINDLEVNGLISFATTQWSPLLWTVPQVAAFMRIRYVDHGRPNVLSVDTNTGNLLPPYSVYAEGLYKTIPATASDPFVYGAMGPVETFWRKTSNYLYSKQKTFFKLDPLVYLKKTWGIKYERAGGYEMNSSYGRKEAPSDFQLHGDRVPELSTLAKSQFNDEVRSLITVTVNFLPQSPQSYHLRCVDRQDGLFEVIRGSKVIGFTRTSEPFVDEYVAILISPKFNHFYWGDQFIVELTAEGQVSTATSLQSTLHVEGLNQLYVQYRRSYGEDVNLSINQTLLKDWTIKAGYRFGGLINTDSLVIRNQDDSVDDSSYRIIVKENKFYGSSWLNSLRVQLVQKGSSQNGGPRMGTQASGEDWVFRVDNFNDARTELSWFKPDLSGQVNNFLALDGRRTSHNWKRYLTPGEVVTLRAPFLIRGIQNVVNFIFGYADKLHADGWRFNDQENPVLDDVTGRPIGFQLLVEQFINQQFMGVDAGSTFVFNPFSRKVWFQTDHGVVANFFEVLGIEQETICTILDQTQRPIRSDEIRVFRQDDLTEVIFDRPCYTIHALVSEYEHAVLFENYSVDSLLIYDSFLGQRANKIFLSGEKQEIFTGRLDLGGHFLLGDQMKRNIENSVSSILGLYDTNGKTYQTDESGRARALLGFTKKDYFGDRGSTDATEFRFWQGMIANKGTNFSIDAYVNSSQYHSAKLDEYWAYKLAEYGDARVITKVEMKVEPEDCQSEHVNFLMLESDELRLIKEWKRNAGFDVANLGITAYDVATLYTEDQSRGFDYVDPRGCVIIRPDDEKRWYRYSDLRAMEYLEAAVLTEKRLVPGDLNNLYEITDARGNLVRADTFEIYDVEDEKTYYEIGEFSNSVAFDTDSFDQHAYDYDGEGASDEFAEYDSPSFVRLNHCTIQITNPYLVGRQLKVIAYGPSFAKYSPSTLIDYRNNVTVRDDVIWWDPARGSHHPSAINEVDIVAKMNPARYNRSLLTAKNASVELVRPWGEEQVGRIWWNTHNLVYQPYSDTKIIPDVSERLQMWGAISDASSIEVYEWVKSSIPPEEFIKSVDHDGDIAIKHILKRNRTWFHRPVAWKFSTNPVSKIHSFLQYQPSRLYVELDGSRGVAILNHGDWVESFGLDIGTKIASAHYVHNDKTDANLMGIFGTLQITSAPKPIIGNRLEYSKGAKFASNPYLKIEASIDERILNFKKNLYGQFKLSYEQEQSEFYVRLTHVLSGSTQRLRVNDLPVLENTRDLYTFDQFGMTISCTSLLARSSLSGSTEFSRMQHAAVAIGSSDHEIWLRSQVDVLVSVPFNRGTQFFLDGHTDVSRNGWIAWTDPEENPNTEFAPPLNRYLAVTGEWSPIQGQLADLAENIREREADPWTWFDGTDYNPYKHTWSDWEEVKSVIIEQRYNVVDDHEEYMKLNFIFPGMSEKELKSRASVFVNEVEIRPAQWNAKTRMNGPFVIGAYVGLASTYVSRGDLIKVVLRPQAISDEDLKFDPEVQDDLFKLVQYKIDYPHVYEESRDENDRFTAKNYYFWVKNKTTPSKIKRMSVAKVSDLLHWHDGTYEVPQIFKQYSQIDGRPNRYALLSVKNLGHYVRQSGMYKLRITNNPTLRNTDNDLDLKNTHTEWVLIRPSQPTKIPKQLWDKMVDTLVGRPATGLQALPFSAYEKYDARNNSSDRYGFGEGQIVSDPTPLLDTVKFTILNTRVDKYEGTVRLPDQISFTGFEAAATPADEQRRVDQLNEYLSFVDENDLNGVRIRKFMADVWRFAKPKQINEIFFAVLEDAAEKNLEISDFFKTSFISLGEIRTVQNAD